MSGQGRAEKQRDEGTKPNLVFPRGVGVGVGRGIPSCPKLKNASRYAGASSTEDESGWESELDVETDIESEMESEVGEDDDGFEADSEGEFGQSPIARITSFNNFAPSRIVGGINSLGLPPIPVNKFFYVPSTGEFVSLETDCENNADDDVDGDNGNGISANDGENKYTINGNEESDTEVEEYAQSGEVDSDDNIFDGKPFLTVDEEVEVVAAVGKVETGSSEAVVVASSDLLLEEDSNSCPIVRAERNLNMLINVITETQQHLNEIFTKHNIPYDFSVPGEEDDTTDSNIEEMEIQSYSNGINSRDTVVDSECSEASASLLAATLDDTLTSYRAPVTVTPESDVDYLTSNGEVVNNEVEVEEEDLAVDVKVIVVPVVNSLLPTIDSASKEEMITSSLTSDEDASFGDDQSSNELDDELFLAFDVQVGLLLAPSVCLMCSLLALCILNFFNIAHVLSTATLVVISASVVLVTFCHLYQFIFSKAVVNPFRAYLEKDLALVFSIMNPLISSLLLHGSITLETFKRAFLFGDLFNSLKLILVTCLFCQVGHLFTVPRLVVSLNSFLFFSRLELKTSALFMLHRPKEYFLTFLKGFF